MPENNCGNCKHWRRTARPFQDLSHVEGQCLEGPPHCVVLGVDRASGSMVINWLYPTLPSQFRACDRFEGGGGQDQAGPCALVIDGNNQN